MKYPLGELLDRKSITQLKLERIPEERVNLTRELDTYNRALQQEGYELFQEVWYQQLYEINGRIWDLEVNIRKGQLQQMTLEDVGRTAIAIRQVNGERVRLKGLIADVVGDGFREVRVNSAVITTKTKGDSND